MKAKLPKLPKYIKIKRSKWDMGWSVWISIEGQCFNIGPGWETKYEAAWYAQRLAGALRKATKT